jgi:hypothetical protein
LVTLESAWYKEKGIPKMRLEKNNARKTYKKNKHGEK